MEFGSVCFFSWVGFDGFIADVACVVSFALFFLWFFVCFLVSFAKNLFTKKTAFMGDFVCSLIMILLIFTHFWQLSEIGRRWNVVNDFIVKNCTVDGCNLTWQERDGLTFSNFQGRRFYVTYGVSTALMTYRINKSGEIEISASKGLLLPASNKTASQLAW